MPPNEIRHVSQTREYKEWRREVWESRLKALTILLAIALICTISFSAGMLFERGTMAQTLKELPIKKSNTSGFKAKALGTIRL